jgi:hypothetical protein
MNTDPGKLIPVNLDIHRPLSDDLGTEFLAGIATVRYHAIIGAKLPDAGFLKTVFGHSDLSREDFLFIGLSSCLLLMPVPNSILGGGPVADHLLETNAKSLMGTDLTDHGLRILKDHAVTNLPPGFATPGNANRRLSGVGSHNRVTVSAQISPLTLSRHWRDG